MAIYIRSPTGLILLQSGQVLCFRRMVRKWRAVGELSRGTYYTVLRRSIGIQRATLAYIDAPASPTSSLPLTLQPQQLADYTFVLIAGRRVRRHRLNCIGVADSAHKACYCIGRRAIQPPVPPCIQRRAAFNDDSDSSDGSCVMYFVAINTPCCRREHESI